MGDRARKFGLIWLCNISAPIAANPIKDGHSLTGFDPAAPSLDGITRASGAARASDEVITMLPSWQSSDRWQPK